jgi:hypothetical protein
MDDLIDFLGIGVRLLIENGVPKRVLLASKGFLSSVGSKKRRKAAGFSSIVRAI